MKTRLLSAGASSGTPRRLPYTKCHKVFHSAVADVEQNHRMEFLGDRGFARVRTNYWCFHREEYRKVAVRHHASITLVPPLIRRIRTEAPNVRLEISEWEERAYDAVMAGNLDTALSAEAPPSGLESEVLFQVDFVCVVGAAQRVHPRRFTLAQYLGLPHVAVETWAGQQTPVDRPLAQFGAKRRVVLSVSFFSAAIFAVANTDLVVTVPRRLTKIVQPLDGVRLVEPPREIKPFPYFMTWHPRLNDEPAHTWFREQVRDAAGNLSIGGSPTLWGTLLSASS
jgi:DNA-binding transcriptional LysR family regulator